MSFAFNVKHEADNLVPVADGTYYTQTTEHIDSEISYQSGDFSLCFYAADGVTPVTPTGGTVKPEMSPIDNIWLEPGVGDVTIDASNVIVESDGVAAFSMPVFVGGAVRGRIHLSGITGATFVKAQFKRFV